MGGQGTRLRDAFSIGFAAIYLGWLSLNQSYNSWAETFIYFYSNLSASPTQFSRNFIWFSAVKEPNPTALLRFFNGGTGINKLPLL